MKRVAYIGFLLFVTAYGAQAQNVGVNSSGATPNSDAVLDLNTGNTWTTSNGKGLLIPRMSSADIAGIATPIPEGLMVFNTDCAVFDYWNGTAWITFPSSTYGPQAVSASLGTNPACSGTVNLTGNATGATSYSWTGPDHFTASVQNPTITITGTVNAGYYAFTATNNCGSVTAYTDSLIIGGAHGNQTFTYVAPTVSVPSPIETFTVPSCVTTLTITAYGAQGGEGGVGGTVFAGGMGAEEVGTFTVTPGEVLSIMVGGMGTSVSESGGGGGGSFVVAPGNAPLIIAGGGSGGATGTGSVGQSGQIISAGGWPGGNGTGNGTGGTGGINGGGGGGASDNGVGTYGSGAGGGGFYGNGGESASKSSTGGTGGNGTNGTNGTISGSACTGAEGQSYTNGGAGGIGCGSPPANGGYGGGSGSSGGGSGAGGGYSGGGGGGYNSGTYGIGGGGGSYNAGTGTSATSGAQSGNGEVIIAW